MGGWEFRVVGSRFRADNRRFMGGYKWGVIGRITYN